MTLEFDLPRILLSSSLARGLSHHPLAEMLLSYGVSDEGPAGWAADVVPDDVQWWGSKRPEGASYLSDEDEEFREMIEDED